MLALRQSISESEIRDHMQQAVNSGLPFLRPSGRADSAISIVGYGPSLHDTIDCITMSDPIIATSGAYDMLLTRNIVSDYYAVLDPTPETVGLLKNPHIDTQYLIASCCHPDWWSKLEGYDVRLWHAMQGDDRRQIEWIRSHHPVGIYSMIGGGSTVAQRALNVAAMLGYRRFNIFGMDCSFTDSRHAGAHTGEIQPVVNILYNDREFKTTPQLLQSAEEMGQFLTTMDAEVTFYGDGLMQEIAKTIQKGKQ